ncbi:hypothetical protein SK571_43110 [Lentzea sp. BCCO 10_0798]|uniref:Uncharacterized protein n=1 Tax=Lentzea kristufekii TaxID=3095430 RepID=A0ABU4U8B7_9PSEU|nr:hypothetical protein [Lentzea sp. BCCO 10_0798]MDX8056206.1 hypothetical protein [Lentzea sp. BCCO 10_0798]
MNKKTVRAGIVAATVLGLFYASVVGGVGGLDHLAQQAVDDWPWLVLILAGFGTQVGLFVELRRRQRLQVDVRAAAGTGAGASAVGMVACCAHHVADLAPIIGASGAAVFLTAYRTPIMVIGIVINGLGVFLSARRLRRTPVPAGR